MGEGGRGERWGEGRREKGKGRACFLIGCLTSQQHARVSQRLICSGNCTCCHTETEVADQIFNLIQSQYTDTGPTSPSADPITSSAWQGSPWSTLSHWYDLTRKKKKRRKRESNPGSSALKANALTTRPTRGVMTPELTFFPHEKMWITFSWSNYCHCGVFFSWKYLAPCRLTCRRSALHVLQGRTMLATIYTETFPPLDASTTFAAPARLSLLVWPPLQ